MLDYEYLRFIVSKNWIAKFSENIVKFYDNVTYEGISTN